VVDKFRGAADLGRSDAKDLEHFGELAVEVCGRRAFGENHTDWATPVHPRWPEAGR
jgi:hypothetical protein